MTIIMAHTKTNPSHLYQPHKVKPSNSSLTHNLKIKAIFTYYIGTYRYTTQFQAARQFNSAPPRDNFFYNFVEIIDPNWAPFGEDSIVVIKKIRKNRIRNKQNCSAEVQSEDSDSVNAEADTNLPPPPATAPFSLNSTSGNEL